ncbi:helix-turn-helix domain-containing protein [Mesorhizobium escarrei]|uniref:Helix-turn-helix domain-containing protein n=1 Tax=Mesorhizobium escarrei TaxID=666018 RepID=A0ABN8K9Y2_9HYPH|nr:hypothetical protein MES5069_550123 [Mesorhizobium escarrei]
MKARMMMTPKGDRYIKYMTTTQPAPADTPTQAPKTDRYVYRFLTAPKKGGRPPTYRSEAAAALAEQGATLAEIAAELKCTVRTVSRWRLNYAEFREALDLGRHKKSDRTDRRAVGACCHRAARARPPCRCQGSRRGSCP